MLDSLREAYVVVDLPDTSEIMVISSDDDPSRVSRTIKRKTMIQRSSRLIRRLTR